MMYFEIRFVDRKSGEVNYAIHNVRRVTYITPSEVGFEKDGHKGGCPFPRSEKLEIDRSPR